jgi:hypothetical protein
MARSQARSCPVFVASTRSFFLPHHRVSSFRGLPPSRRSNETVVARLIRPAQSAPILAPRSSPTLAAGLFSHVHGGAMQRMTTIERAFHLARSATFACLTEVVPTLDREGYSASQIQGPLLKRQLTCLIKAARPKSIDRDLSCGVRAIEERPARKLGLTTGRETIEPHPPCRRVFTARYHGP